MRPLRRLQVAGKHVNVPLEPDWREMDTLGLGKGSVKSICGSPPRLGLGKGCTLTLHTSGQCQNREFFSGDAFKYKANVMWPQISNIICKRLTKKQIGGVMDAVIYIYMTMPEKS